MAKKADKTRARLPRGFVDRHASDIRAVDEMCAKIREVYERYGFDPVETPIFEYTDALGKFLPDQDRPNEGVFSVQDDDEQWLSLRYDLTAPLARHVAENFNDIQLPYRTYRAGYVFRNEKPGPGRFRQFMQFDADTVGAPGVAADAEMCMMMADVMEALGIARGDYVIRVNNRKVLDGVMEAIGVTDEAQKLTVLRSLDKFDKVGREGVAELLTSGRRDESGDFTPGANLPGSAAEKLLRLFQRPEIISGEEENLAVKFGDAVAQFSLTWKQYLQSFKVNGEPVFASGDTGQVDIAWTIPISLALADPVGDPTSGFVGVSELLAIYTQIQAAGYGEDRINIDPSVVRGLEYYTGPVFEAELTAEIPNEKGEIVRFGSVGGGGRYDGLVSRFRGQPVPATGFSIGVSRLATALKNLGKLGQDPVLPPVLITVMDGDTEAMAKYQQFTQALRAAGIRAEMYQGNWKKFGNQLKYADRRGSPLAIIQGADERANGEVQIKDLIEGKKLSAEIESNEEWREARVAQLTVSEDELVETVRKMLAAQAGGAA
ncbi:histidine--tRNA ligase family protein [Nitratireductor sp. L1-7-SE]|uniref:Histidine--tRNA ligase n=1 Tax=Nitratireductor rhodophyticola TaxID=2854036 RepID=A0ABS7R8R8_9HYPH|nr:HisS family protein [Nitratireductor rhodophyticola]MBY8916792.1 histidine--tRNA ligase family protein [Nitratireductor rhodophyticola]MBY8920779.1 histidine--tRNA ligase family protein [Nitratireductor rhodophyticola]